MKISNYKKKRNLKAASSKIGMNNCRSIVKIHDGYLHVEDEKEMFTLELGIKVYTGIRMILLEKIFYRILGYPSYDGDPLKSGTI